MNNQIMVVNGNELHVKEYNGQRVVTLWDIARLHNVNATNIRKVFERNKDKLTENEDYFVINKDDDFARTLSLSKEIDHHILNAAKNIPIFTESGYLLVVKPLTDNIAWMVQRQLVKTYFAMKEVKEIVKNQLDPNSALEHSKFLTSLADMCGVSPEAKLLVAKSMYKLAGVELPFEIKLDQKIYDLEMIAKKLGILSKSGLPHAQAVSEIIKQLDIPDNLKIVTFESKGNWQGSVTKYKEDIFNILSEWLKNNGYPQEIEGNKRRLKVIYKGA